MHSNCRRFLAVLMSFVLAASLVPAAPALAAIQAGSELNLAAQASSSGADSVGKLSKAELTSLWKAIPPQPAGLAIFATPNDNDAYAPATLSGEARAFAGAYLNFIRAQAGLSAVELDETLDANAAQGALILARLNAGLSHEPTTPDGVSEGQAAAGKYACGTSNLSYGASSPSYPKAPLQDAIQGQMDDVGRNMDRLGHRRWLINPAMSTTGIGSAYAKDGSWNKIYTDVRVFGSGDGYGDVGGEGATDYDFVSWPASGDMARNVFEPGVAWSVTLNESRYADPVLADLSVTVSRRADGASWTMAAADAELSSKSKCLAVENSGYGVSNCIIFNPGTDNLGVSQYEGVYDVVIDGLKTAGGDDASLSYSVDFFDAGELAEAEDSGSGDPDPSPDDDLAISKVELVKSKFTYTGRVVEPKVKSIMMSDGSLASGYSASYVNRTDVGTYYVTVVVGSASMDVPYRIVKGRSTLSFKGATKKVSAKAARKGPQVVKLGAKATLGAKVSYSKVSSNSKALTLKGGKVTLKKGTYKKGKTFTMQVKAKAAGTRNFAGADKTVKVSFRIV